MSSIRRNQRPQTPRTSKEKPAPKTKHTIMKRSRASIVLNILKETKKNWSKKGGPNTAPVEITPEPKIWDMTIPPYKGPKSDK